MSSRKTVTQLRQLCHSFRIDLINTLYNAQSGHPGSSLSLCELLAVLYYNVMQVDPTRPNWENRDRLVLSKGHGSPMLYIVMASIGFFPKAELAGLRRMGHILQGHPSMNKIPGVDYTAGPLGLGLSYASGIALGGRTKGQDFYTYCIVGDGELQEGCNWEAVMTIAKYKLRSLITIVDNNGVQLDGTNSQVMPIGNLSERFRAFGMEVITLDGHDVKAIEDGINQAKLNENPTVIIAETTKGKGISFMEGLSSWHGALITDGIYQRAMEELGGVGTEE